MMVVKAINVKRRESEKKYISRLLLHIDNHQNTCVIYTVGCHIAL